MPPIIPPVWAAIALACQFLLPPGRRGTRASLIAAAPVAAAALGIQQMTVLDFRRAQTTLSPDHPERSSRLVTTGPNRFSRNPIYLALALGLTAVAVARRSPLALLPVAGFIAVIDRTQIPAEEVALERTFGRRYREYRARTPRWIGLPRD